MIQAISARRHYPALDGLRGIAILLVVIYHNFGFVNYFFFGWLGVDLFFVISGFLITNILLDTVANRNYLKNFYSRRILRIFPLYYLSFLICLIIIESFNLDGTEYYVKNQLWFWTYLQNWLFIFKLPSDNLLVHFWSLAVEEQFYLVWPFIILWLKVPRKLFIIVTGVLLIVVSCRFLIWTYKIEKISYFSLYTFTRIDGICVGCMVALIMRFKQNFLKHYSAVIVLILAGFNFLFYFFNSQYEFTFPYLAMIGYTTFAVILGLLVYETTTANTKIINILLSIPLLKFFGKISYGFYIFHWPVYILANPFLKRIVLLLFKTSPVIAQIFSSVIATGMAVLISFLSYKYFESYFLKLKGRFT